MDRIVEVLESCLDGMEYDQVFAEKQKKELFIPMKEAVEKVTEVVNSNKKGDSLLISVATISQLHTEGIEAFLVVLPSEDNPQRSAVCYVKDERLFAAEPIKSENSCSYTKWLNVPLKDLMSKKFQIAELYDVFDEDSSWRIFMDEQRGGFLGEPLELLVRE